MDKDEELHLIMADDHIPVGARLYKMPDHNHIFISPA